MIKQGMDILRDPSVNKFTAFSLNLRSIFRYLKRICYNPKETSYPIKTKIKALGISLFLWLTPVLPLHADIPLVFMRPNETPLFTELYQRYGLLNPPALHVYDSSVYLGQPGENTLLIPSGEVFFNDVDKALQAYHSRLGSLNLFLDSSKKYIFTPSNGSLQIIFGLVYAIAMSEPEKQFLFVEKIPFYSFHEHAISYRPYPNARFQGFHDVSEINQKPGETLVEFVTSPNNPDGTFRKPYTKAKIIIADFLFASTSYGSGGTGYIKENQEWVQKARKEGTHIFAFNSVSKALGKPGYRLGYIWFPMEDTYAESIFHNFFSYIWKLTVGGSTPGVADSLNLMAAITSLKDAGQAMRADANNTIVKRHSLVKKELVSRYPGTEVISIEGSPTLFAKLHATDIPQMTGQAILLRDIRAAVDNGNTMGETDEYIRINLCGYSGDITEFLNRLANTKKYQTKDLLVTTANHCTQTTINSQNNSQYVANIADCNINVDAKDGNVVIILPKFINYQSSGLILVKKLDDSSHVVTIQADTNTVTLKKENEASQFQWTQPFFLDGQWRVVGKP